MERSGQQATAETGAPGSGVHVHPLAAFHPPVLFLRATTFCPYVINLFFREALLTVAHHDNVAKSVALSSAGRGRVGDGVPGSPTRPQLHETWRKGGGRTLTKLPYFLSKMRPRMAKVGSNLKAARSAG